MSDTSTDTPDATTPDAAAIEADVCIVGAGPAGLSVATVLAGSGVRVVLLEGGAEATWRQLTEVSAEGDDPYPQGSISETRGSGIGGTAGQWSYRMSNVDADAEAGERGCRYAPMDAIDFEQREAVPHSGWPLTRSDLDPWYAKAQRIAGLGEFAYHPNSWSTPQAQPLELDPSLVETQMFQFAPASVWVNRAAGALRSAIGVLVLTDANVTRLEVDAEGTTVTGVHFARSTGAGGTVRSRAVVLAAGGIETARLLLMSDDRVPGGLGNAKDQVGRYWMEHPLVRGGMLVARSGVSLAERLKLYDAHWQGSTKVMAKLSVAPERMRKEGLLSTSCLFLPRHEALAGSAVQAYTEIRSPSGRGSGLVHQAALGARIALGATHLLTARKAMADQPGLDHSGWSRQPDVGRFRVFEILHQTEQSPDPDNRVVLDRSATDRFGRPLPVLHWNWSAPDRERITRSRDLYGEAFAAAGLGDFVQTDWDNGHPRMIGGNHHHLGGVRMSADPGTGVVDVNARVHGTANLFVAGSSVFPTGGSVNPTLTIVALSLRLGAHLVKELPTLR
ncbi:GMC family oxidoreductase [Kineosporia sp. NBRC 101731]|uniref:FAD-dependent oxidoreductase n=1 Tax=Kineosporia sp. NBRC 101731 TaxID=3032199 RepID=UPI0024A34343|nr:GMC family oxidoreductase [Kineosporia sp. NBRC 101731]GLY31149.1 GMC family oxidoreductase [Kineosporia sp. NBRC 101731]